MGTKKIIKLLMAEGVQRNDAAAFVRAYNKVKHKKVIREHLFGAVPMPCTGEAKTATPSCFRQELAETRKDLLMALEALNEISARLGVE